MDLIDRLQDLGNRAIKLKDQVRTEEATKTAFIMPFLSALGYDVFNPMEVMPEFVADIGTKKGEKVDYCILMDGKPVIILEAKHWEEKMDVHQSQLHRYFHVTSAKFGILTNGIQYRFYTDLEEPNKMDDKPFFEFSIDSFSESAVAELKKFQKGTFNAASIFENASSLRYSKEIKELLARELKNPSEDFVRFFAAQIYPGRLTAAVKEQFTPLVARSAKELISDMINDRLKMALENESQSTEVNPEAPAPAEVSGNSTSEDGVITTEEERQGFRIVQAILRKHVNVSRIFFRDTKSYFGVLLDDNNRKPICRLHLNRENVKYLGLFDEDKKEQRVQIETLEDIYQHEDQLVETLLRYIGEKKE